MKQCMLLRKLPPETDREEALGRRRGQVAGPGAPPFAIAMGPGCVVGRSPSEQVLRWFPYGQGGIDRERPNQPNSWLSGISPITLRPVLYWSITRLASPRSKWERGQYGLGRVGPRKLAWFGCEVIDAARGQNSRTSTPSKTPNWWTYSVPIALRASQSRVS
jgi:hypothetical protein